MKRIALLVVLLFSVVACGEMGPSEPSWNYKGPILYRYVSSDHVKIKLSETIYDIRKGDENDGKNISSLPFRHAFEEDGDVDVYFNGQEYEIDSPYDEMNELIVKSLFKSKKKKTTTTSSSLITKKKPAKPTLTKKKTIVRKKR